MPQTCISDFKGEKILEMSYENGLQKANQKEFRVEKVTNKKVINFMLNGKDTIIRLIAGQIKKTLYK